MSKFDELEKVCIELQKKNDKLREQLEMYRVRVTEIQEDEDKKIELLENEIFELKCDNEELQDKITELEEYIEDNVTVREGRYGEC